MYHPSKLIIPKKMINPESKQNTIDKNEINKFYKFIKVNNIKNILHIGADQAEEVFYYDKIKELEKVIWVEANPDLYDLLDKKFENTKHQLLKYVLYNEDDKIIPFYITHRSACSSIYESLGQIKENDKNINFNKVHPRGLAKALKTKKEINLTSITLSSMLKKYNISPEEIDLIIMDTQGSELDILKGFSDISKIKYILLEVNENMYHTENNYKKINQYMNLNNFYHKNKTINKSFGHLWQDILYYNKNIISC